MKLTIKDEKARSGGGEPDSPPGAPSCRFPLAVLRPARRVLHFQVSGFRLSDFRLSLGFPANQPKSPVKHTKTRKNTEIPLVWPAGGGIPRLSTLRDSLNPLEPPHEPTDGKKSPPSPKSSPPGEDFDAPSVSTVAGCGWFRGSKRESSFGEISPRAEPRLGITPPEEGDVVATALVIPAAGCARVASGIRNVRKRVPSPLGRRPR